MAGTSFFAWMARTGRDFLVAARSLRSAPGFALTAILIFGLGIGVNIAVLSIVDRMLFRPLPYADADQLVQLHNRRVEDGPAPASYLNNVVVGVVRARARAVEDVAIVDGTPAATMLRDNEHPLKLDLSSWNLLRVLGVSPYLGRDFIETDLESFELPVLLTDEAWARRFGRSPDVLNGLLHQARRESRPLRVVGILPAGFLVPASSFGDRSEGLLLDHKERLNEDLGNTLTRSAAIARLKGGVTRQQAQAEVDSLMAAILPYLRDNRPEALRSTARPVSEVLRERPVRLESLRSGLFFAHRSYAWFIVVAALAVFLTASVNLAALLLARGHARQHQSAIRSALGASRAEIVRGAIAEAALICVAGTTIATVACHSMSAVVLALVPGGLVGLSVSVFDPRILASASTAAIVVAVAAGGWPAIRGSRANVVEGLRGQARTTTSPIRGRAPLVAIQAAFGLLLTAGAIATVHNLLSIVLQDSGYRIADLYDVEVGHGLTRDRPTVTEVTRRADRIVDVLRGLPSVVSVSPLSAVEFPIGREPGRADWFWREHSSPRGRVLGVGADYFRTLETTVLGGREFRPDDVTTSAAVAVINRRGASHLWPGADISSVVGRRVGTEDGPSTIVGVVGDQRAVPGAEPIPELYVPFSAASRLPDGFSRELRFAVRLKSGELPSTAAWKTQLDLALGPNPRMPDAVSVGDSLPAHLQRPRFLALLLGSVGVIALILAAVGLYSMTKFEVVRRELEVGVRMGLGASAWQVQRLLIYQALRPVALGTIIGAVAAWWSAGFLQSFVRIDVRGVTVFGALFVIFVVVVGLSAWLPARKATRNDPAKVLRAY